MASRLRDQVSLQPPVTVALSSLLHLVYLQGNEKFVAKDNIGALKLYTESVICAPEVGPELSLAFGNRFPFKVNDWIDLLDTDEGDPIYPARGMPKSR